MRFPVMQFQSMMTEQPMELNLMGSNWPSDTWPSYTVQQQHTPAANNEPLHQVQEDQTLDGTSGRDE
jgi:hypothetical protein